ncbi:MAG: multidrug resistance efflux transporter family protein [Eubacteriales bacterium]
MPTRSATAEMMALCPPEIGTIERIYGMTLCSLPFASARALRAIHTWAAFSIAEIQSLGVAVLSGVIATLLFFRATDLVKESQRQLAVVESTQSFEVLFTLIGGVLLLHDSLPDTYGWVGVGLIVLGMVLSSLASNRPTQIGKPKNKQKSRTQYAGFLFD